MKTVMSYLVKLENGTNAWLAAGKEVPEGATVLEERPLIVPVAGKVLKNKNTEEISSGHWLKNGDKLDDWEEIDEPPLQEPDELFDL